MTHETALTKFVRHLVEKPGWEFVGTFADPPDPPPGYALETKDDGFLGFVTHYRFVPLHAGCHHQPAAQQ